MRVSYIMTECPKIIPEINLTKSDVKLGKLSKKYALHVPKSVRVNDTYFDNPVKINNGTYGVVMKYSHSKDNVIIKVGNLNNNNEIYTLEDETKILSLIKDKKLDKYFVPSVGISGNNDVCDAIIMEMMNGDFCSSDFISIINNMRAKDSQYNTHHTDHFIVSVLIQIVKAMSVLLENKLFYTDLKPDNILYKIHSDGVMGLYLGDLGSVAESDTSITITYLPYELMDIEDHSYGPPKEHYIIWGIGVIVVGLLCLDILALDTSKYKHKNDFVAKLDELKNEVKDKYALYHDIIMGCLEINPDNRWTLNKCNDWLMNSYNDIIKDITKHDFEKIQK